jgi:alkylation response protein AidB-like acyl-CoA dehydrogenase
MAFILSKVLQAPAQLQALSAFAEVDPDLMRQVLDEAGKFVGEVIAPLNRDGDEIGARFEAAASPWHRGFGTPTRPSGKTGWPALACAPKTAARACRRCWNHAVRNAQRRQPRLDHGARPAARRLRVHQTPRQRRAEGAYLPKVATGEWLATMCLTEPHAGSDLGLVRTKAVPQADGSAAPV